ncbi:MAG: lytic transglycosylase domain-containing protein [Christensenellales bacterium]
MKKKIITVLLALVLIIAIIILGLIVNRMVLLSRYSLNYKDLICKYADEYGLDRYLVASVIYTESGDRKDAVSSSGAVGLMQIMPDVGKWIAESLKVENYSDELLLEPEYNIRFGCWLLHTLYKWHGADDKIVLAAYNAGSGNVKKWLLDPNYSSDGVTLHKIPFKETEQYIVKVQNAYEKYKMLYKELGE